MCSLLLQNETTYNPDTIDLNKDKEAAAYWFPCLRELITKFSKQAAISQRQQDFTADQRAEKCCQSYLEKLQEIEQQTEENSKKNVKLSIRELLQLIDCQLHEYGFFDPWLEQKQLENDAAMAKLAQRLAEIDAIQSLDERWTELVRGVVAGNLFDSGAGEVTLLLKNKSDFGLESALKCVEKRPWLIDNLDELLFRFRQNTPHKCAAIFVDNSGVDIVLGILPFARELLRCGTKVLLCANSEPSLNDVTADELRELLKKCPCMELTTAWSNQRLLVYDNGQRGPCLDMRNLPLDLCQAFINHNTDLLIIEGMGRALHTNFNAEFSCESLKILVVKNKWLAQRLGGNIFSAICKYDRYRY